MRYRTFAVCVLAVFLAVPLLSAKDDWLPIPPADLAMKDNPVTPGSPAMILHREVYTTNEQDFQTEYVRIKIFTEEGKKYADIEIPYLRNTTDIADVKARTIHPDGSIVPFTGKVYDKIVVKSRWVRVHAKAFSLPDVQAGSIIEFKYTWFFQNRLYGTSWDVQSDLFTRHAKFSIRPYGQMFLRWTTYGLPPSANPKEVPGGIISLEMDNIPGLKHESYMPPESVLKMRVNFFYSEFKENMDPAKYWSEQGKEWSKEIEKFIGNRGAIKDAALQAAPASDPPETRLRKLYALTQKIRNRSYEEQKTEKEEQREKIAPNLNVEDVLKRGFGYRYEISRLFVGLARAAGFEASEVPISERDAHFFNAALLNPYQFDAEVALVKLNGKDLFLDPGTPYCTFGLLSWAKTGVKGLLTIKGQTTLIKTPDPTGADAVLERKADFQLSDTGDLAGKLEITFTGQEAVQRKLENLHADDTARTKSLEKDVKSWLPASATVKVEQMSGWTNADDPLRATVSVKVEGYATATSRRMLLPRSLFQIGHPFRVATREHPVYVEFPYRTKDEITLTLPPGFTLEGTQYPTKDERNFAAYTMTVTKQGNTLKVNRTFGVEGFYFLAEHYPVLKEFFDGVGTADEQQLVLRSEAGAAGK